MSAIATLLEHQKKRLNIAVVGDIMLDIFHPGKLAGYAAEGPDVQILKSNGKITRLGGAGNAAEQFMHLNVNVTLLGGVDEEALEIYRTSGLGYLDYIAVPHVPRKHRFYDELNHVMRWDEEYKNYMLDGDGIAHRRDQLLGNVWRVLSDDSVDMLVISDYDKGMFSTPVATKIIKMAQQLGIPTLVDPKHNCDRWIGCDYFKPNVSEAKTMAPDKTTALTLKHLLNSVAREGVVATDGETGAYYAGKQLDDVRMYSTKYGRVRGVSCVGAGDCFAAFLATALAYKMPLEEAVEVAYEAGACYVQHQYNEPVTLEALKKRDPRTSVASAEVMAARAIRDMYPDSRIVFTNGCFDVLHPGHIELLRFAAEQGDKLVVGLNSDASVRKLKGEGRPVFTSHDRAAMLRGFVYVDDVIVFDSTTPIDVIKALRPDVLVKGADYNGLTIAGQDIVPKTVLCPLVQGHSTSAIVKKLREEHEPAPQS